MTLESKKRVPYSNARKVATVVCDYMGISVESLKNKTRQRAVVESRKLIAHILRTEMRRTHYQVMCVLLGKGNHVYENGVKGKFDVDHTMSVYYFKEAQNLMDTDVNFRKTRKEIKQRLKTILR